MQAVWKVSQRKACAIIQLDPKSYRYKSHRPGQAAIEQRIREICQTRVRYGYRRVHVMLRREGWNVNHKKTRRIYNELGLNSEEACWLQRPAIECSFCLCCTA